MHNFVGQDIIDAGGFSVSMKINAIETATGQPGDRYVGFGVGLTQAEAAEGSDISGTKTFRGSQANPVGKADFFIELDINRNVKVWSHGQLLDTIPVGTTNGTLTASFALKGFTPAHTVTVSVFFDGRLLDINTANASSTTRSFTWGGNNANYIGLSARTTKYGEIDNLAIRKLPLGPALASEYILSAGLTEADSGLHADPDQDGDSNLEEWLKGGKPQAHDSSRQLLAVTPGAQEEFTFSYYRLREAGQMGIAYDFQTSTNLSQWTSFSPEVVSTMPDVAGYERVMCRVPAIQGTGRAVLFILLQTRGSPL
jgi:hypothetical protein